MSINLKFFCQRISFVKDYLLSIIFKKNKIEVVSLADIYIIRYSFTDKKFVKKVC